MLLNYLHVLLLAQYASALTQKPLDSQTKQAIVECKRLEQTHGGCFIPTRTREGDWDCVVCMGSSCKTFNSWEESLACRWRCIANNNWNAQIFIQKLVSAPAVSLGLHGLLILSISWKENAAQQTKSSASMLQLGKGTAWMRKFHLRRLKWVHSLLSPRLRALKQPPTILVEIALNHLGVAPLMGLCLFAMADATPLVILQEGHWQGPQLTTTLAAFWENTKSWYSRFVILQQTAIYEAESTFPKAEAGINSIETLPQHNLGGLALHPFGWPQSILQARVTWLQISWPSQSAYLVSVPFVYE